MLGVDNAFAVEEADRVVCEWVWILSCCGGGDVLCENVVEDKVAGAVANSVLVILSAMSLSWVLWSNAYVETPC